MHLHNKILTLLKHGWTVIKQYHGTEAHIIELRRRQTVLSVVKRNERTTIVFN